MDKEYFVQKVKFLCLQKGIKPTNACRESGVGVSFLNGVERGASPTIANLEKLATYLDTSVGDLIGEERSKSADIPDQPYLVMRYNQLSKEDQLEVMTFIEFKAMQAKDKTGKNQPLNSSGKDGKEQP